VGLPNISWIGELDGVARVITFDKRGTGLSDRSLGFGSLEERICDLAGDEEILVSRTVKDLVIGSATEFADRGTHELKGVPGSRPVFAVA